MSALLSSLVGDVEAFRAASWKRAVAFGHAEPPALTALDLITEDEMLETLASGPLVWPYFGLHRDGEPLPAEQVTTERRVLNVSVPGYPRRRTVLAAHRDGATLAFRQPEHWHAGIRALLTGLQPAFDAELRSYAVLTPAGGSGDCADTAVLDMLVVQLAGRAEWTATPRGAGAPYHRVLTPGDVLYIPHDVPRNAVAGGDGASLHLAVTVEEPTPRDLVDVLAAEFLKRLQAEETTARHHLVPAAEKARWLLDRMAVYQADLDARSVARAAVGRRVGGAGPSS